MNIRFAAVAAASAFATLPSWGQGIQVTGATNITISGLLTVGAKEQQINQGNAASARPTNSEFRVDDNTSRLIITSTSKITDGWSVIARVESRFLPDTKPGDVAVNGTAIPVANASGWADGDSYGAVSSPYGTLLLGKSTLYYADTISLGYLAPSLEAPGEGYRIWDVNGLGTFNLLDQYLRGTTTAVSQTFILGVTRSRNVVRYDSIPFKLDASSILDFSLAYTKNAAGSELSYPTGGAAYERGGTYYGRVRFNGHGFSASASYLDQKYQGVLDTAPNAELKATRLGLSYKWEGLKVGLVYDSTTQVNGRVTSDAKRSVIEVPISYAFGDHAVYATYTKASNTSSMADTGARQMNLVYDYALTKRAFVGVFFTKLDNDKNANYQPFVTGYVWGGSAVAAGESWRQIGVHLNYWF